jgi:hypothetical protein
LRSADIPALPTNQAGGFARSIDFEGYEEIEIGISEGNGVGRFGLFDVGVKQTAPSDRSSVANARRWRTTDVAHALNPPGDC